LSATFLSSLLTILELPSTPSVPLHGACPDPIGVLSSISSLIRVLLFTDHSPLTCPDPVEVTVHHSFKSFSCNTYGPPRKCCKQKTYSMTKPFRCNTYKKPGGPFRLRIFRRADARMFGTRGHLRT